MSHESGSSRYRWVLLSLSCCRRFGEVCLPTRDEIGLVASYHLSWWFSSPLGFFVVRRIEASVCSWAVRFPWPDDVLATGHLLQPDRSTTTKHVVFDMLLKTATTNFLSSPGRRLASSRGCQSPVAKKTGRWLQGLGCNFYFFQGYFYNTGCNHPEYK